MFIYQAKNINIIIRNTQALLDPSTEVDLNVKTEETNNMYMFHHQNAGQIHNINTTNKSLKNGGTVQVLGSDVCYVSIWLRRTTHVIPAHATKM
jgi:hypothetical protein